MQGVWAYLSMQMLSPLLRSGSAYRVEMHLAWHDETSRLKTSVTISSSAVAASIWAELTAALLGAPEEDPPRPKRDILGECGVMIDGWSGGRWKANK